ncbi:MAG: hypothetical protein PHO02_04920 [Candidatus Nanoarchaeia archaeon]|nr:hypothetical protein [Candidatus Nanoarchaeia archaeon]
MKSRKGEGAVEISTFIVLMALFIILYIVLLPPGERDEILGETSSAASAGEVAVAEGSKVLLSESPGQVFAYSKNINTFNLEPVHLYLKDETTQTPLVKSLSVSRNLIKDNFKNVLFTIDNMDKVSSAKLFLVVAEGRNRLTIKLNDRIVYQGALTSEQLPIDLPKEYLQKNNKLTFSTDLPPMSEFYKSTYYLLQDIKLIKTETVEQTETARSFFVDSTAGTVRKATLGYIVNCNAQEPRGQLSIKLNNNLVSKDTIFCDFHGEIKLPLAIEKLSSEGRNRLVFSIDKGDYSLDMASVKIETGKSTYPSYTFDINSDDYNAIDGGSKKLFLKFKFRDSGRKKASVSVQESEFSFDTSASEYSKDISAMVDNGANYVKIVPREDFEIVNMKAVLENA